MAYAWFEGNNIFVSKEKLFEGENVIEVPDHIAPQDLKIENGRLVFKSESERMQELIKEIKKEAFNIYKDVVREKLDEYGYIDLGDVRIYASLNYKEAKNLLNWYLEFDDIFWNWIDEELPSKDYSELMELKSNLHDIIKGFAKL